MLYNSEPKRIKSWDYTYASIKCDNTFEVKKRSEQDTI